MAKPTDFYANRVKSICIHRMSQAEIILIQPDVVRRILSTFTGLQNIALFDTWSAGDDTFFKNASQKSKIGQHLRPRSLTCHLERFFAIHTIPNRQPDFALPFFSRLTHLEILDPVKTWTLWTGLELIPCLTHLAFKDLVSSLSGIIQTPKSS